MKHCSILAFLVCVGTILFSTFPSFAQEQPKDPAADFVRSAVEQKAPLIIDMKQSIWNYAEIRYKEFKSASKIAEILERDGFAVDRNIPDMPTAFVARYGSGSPVIGITAEYDSLPRLNQEAGVAEPKPTPDQENGHGCGHCALGAGAVGAALAVKEYLKDKPGQGTIVLLGTPAEESGYGKLFMLRKGCFKDIDIVMSWHPWASNNATAARALGVYLVEFHFKGVAAHAGAEPEKGRSAVDACELTNVGMNYMREHVPSSTRMHYAWLDSGPKAANIVPDSASLVYYVRAPYQQQRDEVLKRLINIAKGAALMTDTTLEYQVVGAAYDLAPNPTVAKVLSDSFVEMGGPDFGETEFEIARRFLAAMPEAKRDEAIRFGAKTEGVTPEQFAQKPLIRSVVPYSDRDSEQLLTLSFDLGDVSYCVPTAQLYGAVAIPQTGLHTWQLTAQVGTSIGDKASLAMARALALAAVRFYQKPELVGKAQAEFKEATNGQEYKYPLPDTITPKTLTP